MSGELSPRTMLSSNRSKDPIQHLPFFASTDLQIGCSPRQENNEKMQENKKGNNLQAFVNAKEAKSPLLPEVTKFHMHENASLN